MKRILLIFLIVVAIPLYGWDVYLLLGGGMAGDGGRSREATSGDPFAPIRLSAVRAVRFQEKGRSPLLASTPKPRPRVQARPVMHQPTPRVEIKPPAVTITGIMWNPSNPLAMLRLPDGSSTVAGAGQKLAGEIEVLVVERARIRVRYQGKSFWIGK